MVWRGCNLTSRPSETETGSRGAGPQLSSGAILLRGPLRLKQGVEAYKSYFLSRCNLTSRPSETETPTIRRSMSSRRGAILLRGPLRLKRSTRPDRRRACLGAILLRGPLRLKRCMTLRKPRRASGCNLTSRPSETETRLCKISSKRCSTGCNLTSRPSETETQLVVGVLDGLLGCNLTSRPSETETAPHLFSEDNVVTGAILLRGPLRLKHALNAAHAFSNVEVQSYFEAL